jgi:hypothetical protein
MAGEPCRDHANNAVPLGIPELGFLSGLIGVEKCLPVWTWRGRERRQRFTSMTHVERDVRLRDFDQAVERGFRGPSGRRDVPLQRPSDPPPVRLGEHHNREAGEHHQESYRLLGWRR